jgi:hypothetical protein
MFRIILIFVTLITSGCTDQRVKDRFSFNYETPNEFQVQKKPPLVMPKNDQLPEPQTAPSKEEEL